MVFHSYIFILVFLPMTIIGYYILDRKGALQARQIWLITMSLVFCGYFSVQSLFVLLMSVIVNYSLGSMIHNRKSRAWQQSILGVGIFANVSMLLYFKYMDFFIQNMNELLGNQSSFIEVIWPLGISFYTFSQISYLVDTYHRGEKSSGLMPYLAYITYFPKLTSGPIALYEASRDEFATTAVSSHFYENISKGIFLFTLGLGKKVLVADYLVGIVNTGYAETANLTSTQSVVVILAYTAYIYFDFSGYCDMAVGVSRMFGISLPINFNSPYKAVTISDFWNRWHITLSRFFTQYLYIPLGGNRKGVIRMLVNTLIVFLVSGLWHGSNWTFLVWGLLHGLAVCLDKLIKHWSIQIPKLISWCATFVIVNVAWVYFRADSISQANTMLRNVVTRIGVQGEVQLAESLFDLLEFRILQRLNWNDTWNNNLIGTVFVVICVCVTLIGKNSNQRTEEFRTTIKSLYLTWILLLWCMVSLTGVATFVYLAF